MNTTDILALTFTSMFQSWRFSIDGCPITQYKEILGPYADIQGIGTHSVTRKSQFHRSVDFCGSCHNASNPTVGDLAHNHGA